MSHNWYPVECEHGFDYCPVCDGGSRPSPAGVAYAPGRRWISYGPEKRKRLWFGGQKWFWTPSALEPEVLGFDELEPVQWVQCMGKWMVGFPSPDGRSIRLEDGLAHMVATVAPKQAPPWYDMDIFEKHGWVYDDED